MSNIQHLCLLRGINVGGKNIIKMANLKACFEEMGFTDVDTYIQSGNVIFSDNKNEAEKLTKLISGKLAKKFDYHQPVAVFDFHELRRIIKNAPEGFGEEPEKYKYDVVFIIPPLTSEMAFSAVKTRKGVDFVFKGEKVLYFSRIISKAGQSYLSKIISDPVYQNMTIRNWNTATRLLEKTEENNKIKS